MVINTILGVALALAVCVVIFAGAICWLADQEEKMKGEDDYPKDRPLLKVSVVKDDKKANNNVYEIVMNSPYRAEELRKFVSRDAKVYETVKTFSDGSELRRYNFYDGSVYSVIFSNGCLVDFVPIEKEDDLITWWEALIEDFKEVDDGNRTNDI